MYLLQASADSIPPPTLSRDGIGDERAIYIYTDGSKEVEGASCGVYSDVWKLKYY